MMMLVFSYLDFVSILFTDIYTTGFNRFYNDDVSF